MKKTLVFAMVVSLCASMFAQNHAKQLWNDGQNDYVPAGAKVTLAPVIADSKPAKIFYSLDFGALTEYDGDIVLTEEGPHWISYLAEDVFGQMSSSKIYAVIVDDTAPELKFGFKGPTYLGGENGDTLYITSSTGLWIQGEDTSSGLAAIYSRVGDNEYTSIPSSDCQYITDEPDGEYVYSIYLVDNVGNTSDVTTRAVYLDNTAPEFVYTFSTEPVDIDGATYIARDTVCTVAASDAASGVQGVYVAIDDDDFMKYESEFRMPVEGAHTLKVYAVDNLGNTTDVMEFPFVISTKAPDTEITVTVGEVATPRATVTVGSTDYDFEGK